MKEGYTHISVVLDKSGSMDTCLNDTIGGFNSFINSQKEEEGEATFTLAQFNGSYDLVTDMQPLNDISELDRRNYCPGGGTALLDAIGRTVNEVEHQIEDMDEDEQPEKVIFVIITDGEENSSREFSRENVMEMIDRHQIEDNWEFIFIGANQDAIQAGGGMGIRAGATLNYTQDAVGTRSMYSSLSKGMTTYRCAAVADTLDANFFAEEDEEEQDELIGENPNPNAKIKGQFQNMSIYTQASEVVDNVNKNIEGESK